MNSDIRTQIDLGEQQIRKLAMLSGILGRSPSEIVSQLLDASFPDHIVKKWEEEPRSTVRSLHPTVKWE